DGVQRLLSLRVDGHSGWRHRRAPAFDVVLVPLRPVERRPDVTKKCLWLDAEIGEGEDVQRPLLEVGACERDSLSVERCASSHKRGPAKPLDIAEGPVQLWVRKEGFAGTELRGRRCSPGRRVLRSFPTCR